MLYGIVYDSPATSDLAVYIRDALNDYHPGTVVVHKSEDSILRSRGVTDALYLEYTTGEKFAVKASSETRAVLSAIHAFKAYGADAGTYGFIQEGYRAITNSETHLLCGSSTLALVDNHGRQIAEAFATLLCAPTLPTEPAPLSTVINSDIHFTDRTAWTEYVPSRRSGDTGIIEVVNIDGIPSSVLSLKRTTYNAAPYFYVTDISGTIFENATLAFKAKAYEPNTELSVMITDGVNSLSKLYQINESWNKIMDSTTFTNVHMQLSNTKLRIGITKGRAEVSGVVLAMHSPFLSHDHVEVNYPPYSPDTYDIINKINSITLGSGISSSNTREQNINAKSLAAGVSKLTSALTNLTSTLGSIDSVANKMFQGVGKLQIGSIDVDGLKKKIESQERIISDISDMSAKADMINSLLDVKSLERAARTALKNATLPVDEVEILKQADKALKDLDGRAKLLVMSGKSMLEDLAKTKIPSELGKISGSELAGKLDEVNKLASQAKAYEAKANEIQAKLKNFYDKGAKTKFEMPDLSKIKLPPTLPETRLSNFYDVQNRGDRK